MFIALDARRFGWSHAPLWAQWIGAALIVGAFIGWVGVLRANTFASVTVRLQKERGQTVISTGPYAVVRHPMYAYAIPLCSVRRFFSARCGGFLGVFVAMPLMAARALGEEAVLMDGLAGYREDAARVRFPSVARSLVIAKSREPGWWS